MKNSARVFQAAVFSRVKPLLAAALLAGSGFLSNALADTVLISDDYTLSSGTYQKLGTFGLPTTSITTLSGFGDGNVRQLNGAFFRPFDNNVSFTLNSLTEGQVLSMSFDLRMTSLSDLSFGFIGASSSVMYTMADLLVDSFTGTRFFYRAASANMSNPGDALPVTGAAASSTFTEPATSANTGYHLELNITKLLNGFTFSYYRDDTLVGSATVSSSSAFATAVGNTTITGVGFRFQGSGNYYLDNMEVTLVPEPATWVMMIGGAGVLFLGQRLRRAKNA